MLLTSTLEEERWDENVRKIKFAISNTVNKSTGETPSELLLGYKPRDGIDTVLKDEVTQVKNMVIDIHIEREKAANRNIEAQTKYKRTYDRKRKAARKYKLGDFGVGRKAGI